MLRRNRLPHPDFRVPVLFPCGVPARRGGWYGRRDELDHRLRRVAAQVTDTPPDVVQIYDKLVGDLGLTEELVGPLAEALETEFAIEVPESERAPWLSDGYTLYVLLGMVERLGGK